MLMARAALRGFTIVEVMIALVVLGVLVSMAGPSFGEWLQNSQTRAASDAMQNGLQVARGAAVSRNLPVRLLVGPGSGWTVAEAASGSVIQSRVHEEGSPNVGVNTTPVGSSLVTFSPLGAVAANADGTPSVTQMDFINPSGGACQVDGGGMRCLRILISGGGSIRMCDPKLTAMGMTTDPRACP